MEKVAKGVFNFEGDEWQQISQEAKSLIKKMLEYEPLKRVGAEQCYSDAWLKKYAKKDVVDIPIITKALENMRTFRVKINKNLKSLLVGLDVRFFVTIYYRLKENFKKRHGFS